MENVSFPSVRFQNITPPSLATNANNCHFLNSIQAMCPYPAYFVEKCADSKDSLLPCVAGEPTLTVYSPLSAFQTLPVPDRDIISYEDSIRIVTADFDLQPEFWVFLRCRTRFKWPVCNVLALNPVFVRSCSPIASNYTNFPIRFTSRDRADGLLPKCVNVLDRVAWRPLVHNNFFGIATIELAYA